MLTEDLIFAPLQESLINLIGTFETTIRLSLIVKQEVKD